MNCSTTVSVTLARRWRLKDNAQTNTRENDVNQPPGTLLRTPAITLCILLSVERSIVDQIGNPNPATQYF
jgi:hypothetical protein